MKITVPAGMSARDVARRAFFLAYEASVPMGMGFLHARGGLGEGDIAPRHDSGSRIDGDYVVGRMMKIHIEYDADSVTVSDRDPRPDYQSWSETYPTYRELIEAAVRSLSPAPAR